jgi:hypothetical protein
MMLPKWYAPDDQYKLYIVWSAPKAVLLEPPGLSVTGGVPYRADSEASIVADCTTLLLGRNSTLKETIWDVTVWVELMAKLIVPPPEAVVIVGTI